MIWVDAQITARGIGIYAPNVFWAGLKVPHGTMDVNGNTTPVPPNLYVISHVVDCHFVTCHFRLRNWTKKFYMTLKK